MVKQMQDRKNDHNSYTQFSMQRYNIKSVASDFKHFAKASSVGIIPAALSPLTFPFVSVAVAGQVWDLTSPIFAHVLRLFSINHLIDLVNMTNQPQSRPVGIFHQNMQIFINKERWFFWVEQMGLTNQPSQSLWFC